VAVRIALEEYAKTTSPDPETGRYQPLQMTNADAVVEMAHAWMSGRERLSDRPAVIVHADAAVLSGGDGWAESPYGPLAAETIRRMACYCHLGMVIDEPAGDPLRVGRTQRRPSWQLGEMVRRRDGGCRFPGCGRTHWTQAHHVAEWDADQGPTDYENLSTLCRADHRRVHEGGWKMEGDPCGELRFISPTGVVLSSWPNETGRPRTDPPPGAAAPPGAATEATAAAEVCSLW
jgi:hypothetical protein